MNRIRLKRFFGFLRVWFYTTILYVGAVVLIKHFVFNGELTRSIMLEILVTSIFMGFFLVIINRTWSDQKVEKENPQQHDITTGPG